VPWLSELKEKRYRAQPVRRVTSVRNRTEANGCWASRPFGTAVCAKQALRSPCFGTDLRTVDFHPSSYGYRPWPQAPIRRIQQSANCSFARYQRHWVLVDYGPCPNAFDTLDHDLILASSGVMVTDGSVLGLLEHSLKQRRWMLDTSTRPRSVGSPQSGVIQFHWLRTSIWIAFDQVHESRGHRIVRLRGLIILTCVATGGIGKNLRWTLARGTFEGDLKLTATAARPICHTAGKVSTSSG